MLPFIAYDDPSSGDLYKGKEGGTKQMKVKVNTLKAFAKTPEGGNPAGVVLETVGLSPEEMRGIAAKVGFSETAFVEPSDCADYRVRFFTPAGEVDLCGHATIATFSLMFQKGMIKPDTLRQETLAGVLDIIVQEEGSIFMEQTLPVFSEIISGIEITDTLNLPEDSLREDLPVQIVSTGLRDILVPVRDLKVLHHMEPDFSRVTETSRKYNAVGYHVFSLETLYGSTAHCRNLAPLYDIPEESATGTSSGALACYLFRYGRLASAKRLVFEQGYCMDQPSEIFAELGTEGDRIIRVLVGGKALTTGEMHVEIE